MTVYARQCLLQFWTCVAADALRLGMGRRAKPAVDVKVLNSNLPGGPGVLSVALTTLWPQQCASTMCRNL